MGDGTVCTNFPYDVAAAALILEEAGGVVTHADGRAARRPPRGRIGRGPRASRSLGAASPELHERLLAAIDRGMTHLGSWPPPGSQADHGRTDLSPYDGPGISPTRSPVVTIVLIVVAVLVVLFVLYADPHVQPARLAPATEIDNAYSQIDVQLKRRYDLIPNLVETVKGYAAHEKSHVRGRHQRPGQRHQGAAGQLARQQAQAENVLSGALKSLFAVAEAYPDLKANQNFLNLQEELTSTEDRIAYARQFYNDSVLGYNNKIQSFPGNMIAGIVQLHAARVLRGRPRGNGPGQGPVLGPRRSPGTVMGMYEQIARNKRRTFVMLAAFVLLDRARRGRARDPVPGGGWAGPSSRSRSSSRSGSRAARTSTRTRSRSPRAGRSRPTGPSTGAITTSSRGCASPPGCRSRGSTSSTTRRPNAFATGRNPKHAALAVTTGLLEKMNRVELEGVLAHELSHVKNYDILVTTVAVTAVGAVALMADLGMRFRSGAAQRSRRDNNDSGALGAASS